MALEWFNGLFAKHDECLCRSSAKDLSQAADGRRVRIKCLNGDESSCQRLREMGFCEAAIVEKVSGSGALLCKVCDSKVVLSRELARNIIVQEVCPMKGHQPQGNSQTVPLSKMSLGQRGTIEDFTDGSDDCERLEEMGLTPGEAIEVVRYAPLGDPIEIKVRGYCLSLRRQEAERIKIKLIK